MGIGPSVVVTDETSLPELVECLVNLNATAKRCQTIVGSEAYPSAWDKASARVDAVLDEIRGRL